MSKPVGQLAKFGIVGALNTGIDFLLFTLLTLAGWSYAAAQCASYMCGTANSYLWNRSWTFRSANGRRGREFARFAALNALALLLTSCLIETLHAEAGWPALPSKALATLLGVAVNFTGSRLWVFRPNHPERQAAAFFSSMNEGGNSHEDH